MELNQSTKTTQVRGSKKNKTNARGTKKHSNVLLNPINNLNEQNQIMVAKGGSRTQGQILKQPMEKVNPNIMDVDKGKVVMELIKSKSLDNEFLL